MQIDQILSAAVEAMRRGALPEAESRCRSVLEIVPQHFFATLILADVLLHARRTTEAAELYEKATTINPGHALAFSRLAMMRFRANFGAPLPPRRTPKGARRMQMTTLGSKGRFGNQLLQYAIVRLYAKMHGLVAELPDWIGRDLFDLDDPLPSAKLPMADERSADIFSLLAAHSSGPFSELDVSGYFGGSTAPISVYRDEFRAFFAPGRKVARLLDQAMNRLRSAGKTIVAVHLRRSDFGYSRFWVAPASWYAAWLKTLWPMLDAPLLYVATEDRKSVADLGEFSPWDASGLLVDIPGAEFLIDHHILRQADHVAIANSTFSYTAAMLNAHAKSFARPDPDARKLVPFDPWAAVVLCDPAVPSQETSAAEREVLRRYFSDGDSVLHLGQHCSAWTNLARSVHPNLTVHEAAADASVDEWRSASGVRHLRHLVVEHPTRLPDVIEHAQKSLAYARIDMLHFHAAAPLTMPEAAVKLARDGYVLLQAKGRAFERLTLDGLFEPGRYFVVQERLLPLLFARTGQGLDLPALCLQHEISVRGVVHVGAHEGSEIAAYDAMPADRVLFVEANPAVYERLVANMRQRSDVMTVNRAVADKPGRVQLHLASFDQSSSLLPMALHREIYSGIFPAGTIEIEAATLDALMVERGLLYRDFNFLNVDVQGAEAMVLRGANEMLVHVDAVNIEVNFVELYRGGAEIEEIDDLLSSAGFRRVAVLSPFDASWGDAFYVRRARIIARNSDRSDL